MSILALGRKQKKREKRRKFPIKEWEKAKKRKKIPNQKIERKQKEKIPNQRVGESKKRKKIPDQGSEENRRNMQKGLWTRQYLDNTELSPSKHKKKGNHDLKWSSPFDCQPKSCASVTCSPRTKQNQKRKRPRTLKAKVPTKKPIPKKSHIDS